MKIQEEKLRNFIQKIAATRPDEISCDGCYEHLNRFAEMLQDGKDPIKVMPLVQHHIEMCAICGEEFEALIKAMEAVSTD